MVQSIRDNYTKPYGDRRQAWKDYEDPIHAWELVEDEYALEEAVD